MSETQQEAPDGVADAVRGLSDNTKTLVRREIAAAELEMLGKAKQALPSVALLGAAGLFGVLSLAASYRLSVRLLEKTMSPAAAALVAATGYGAAAGASGAVGMQRLHADGPLIPVETVRATVAAATGKAKAVAGTAAKSAADTARKAVSVAGKQASGATATEVADKAKATAGSAATRATGAVRKTTDTAKKAMSGTTVKQTADAAKKTSTAARSAASRARTTTNTAAKKATDTGKTAPSSAETTTGTTGKKPASTAKKPADKTARTTRPRTSRQDATPE